VVKVAAELVHVIAVALIEPLAHPLQNDVSTKISCVAGPSSLHSHSICSNGYRATIVMLFCLFQHFRYNKDVPVNNMMLLYDFFTRHKKMIFIIMKSLVKQDMRSIHCVQYMGSWAATLAFATYR
jgi:hypothetical protein